MSESSNPTRAVREGEELDWPALTAHLSTVLPEIKGQPRISQFPSGNSNLTYLLEYPQDNLVLRRPPFGTKAKSAHSMSREYTVMNALRPVFETVPETLYYTDDESIVGSEFYVMRRVEGDALHRGMPAAWGFDRSQTRRFCEAFWSRLVALHQVDIEAAGLSDFGRPQGYAQRQVEGWNRRFVRAGTPDVDEFVDVQAWLAANVPADPERASVLHGDYRMDNVIVDSEDPLHILAVLDWEISALGDPLMDLGNALAYWVQADDPPYLKALLLQPSAEPGMMTRAEILDFYAEQTGRSIPDFTFYLTYGYFRNTVILQQIYYRYFHGQTQDQRFSRFGELANALGNHCRGLIAG